MTSITVLDKSNAPTGPFTREQIAEKLQSGEFSLDTLAFIEGLAQWTPLRDVLAQVDGIVPLPVSGMPPVVLAAGGPPAYSYSATMQPPGGLVYAGFWLRFVAYIVDSIIISIPIFVLEMIVGVICAAAGIAGHSSGSSDSSNPMSPVLAIVLGLVIMVVYVALIVGIWLYFAKMESGPMQATWGKRILGLKVTNLAGERITFGQATGRFFGKIVSGMTMYIGFIMAGFTERKQALHDMMASTLVIRS